MTTLHALVPSHLHAFITTKKESAVCTSCKEHFKTKSELDQKNNEEVYLLIFVNYKMKIKRYFVFVNLSNPM